MVLALWYSRAALERCYSGATCHTSREIQLEAFQSARAAHRRVPGDRRVRRNRHRSEAMTGPPAAGPRHPPRPVTTVVAAQDIPLGATLTAGMLTTTDVQAGASASRAPSATRARSSARPFDARSRTAPSSSPRTSSRTPLTTIVVPEGKRAISVQVDQVNGVGTLIKTGDYVDLVLGLTGDKFPVVTLNPDDESITVVAGPEQHERQAPHRGHAGDRHDPPADHRDQAGPTQRRPAAPPRRRRRRSATTARSSSSSPSPPSRRSSSSSPRSTATSPSSSATRGTSSTSRATPSSACRPERPA